MSPAGRRFTLGESGALGRFDFVVFVGAVPFDLADSAGLEPVFLAPRWKLYRLGGRLALRIFPYRLHSPEKPP